MPLVPIKRELITTLTKEKLIFQEAEHKVKDIFRKKKTKSTRVLSLNEPPKRKQPELPPRIFSQFMDLLVSARIFSMRFFAL